MSDNNDFSQLSPQEEEQNLCDVDAAIASSENTLGDLLKKTGDPQLQMYAGLFFGQELYEKCRATPITDTLVDVFLQSYYLYLEELEELQEMDDSLQEQVLPAAPVCGRASAPACTFFQQGRCNKGPSCCFSHDAPSPAPVGGGRAPAPAPKPCHFFQKGRCNKGASCRFSHMA